MNASHIAGGGLGAIVGAIIVALGQRIGLDLTNFDSAVLGAAAIAVGAGVFHVIGKAWSGEGLLPAVRRGFLGPKAVKTTQESSKPPEAVRTAPVASQTPPTQ